MPCCSMPFCGPTPHKKILPIRHVMGSSPLHAGTGIVRSASPTRATVGWRRGAGNCCRSAMHMWCSPCRVNWRRWHLGAEIGFFSVLHTWNQKLLHHPHVHCVVPAGGLSPDHTRWIAARTGFFLPVRVLSRVFRGKFVAGLRQLHAAGKLEFHGKLEALAAPVVFAAMLRTLFRNEWVVYAKPPFHGAEHALRYLGCYTHRVAISNHRLVALEDGEVVFRWRDSARHNKKRLMRLALDEFLRRFFLHVLPRGFVRIRHFGFFAHRRRAALLPLVFELLKANPEPQPAPAASATEGPRPLWTCPRCGGPMALVERFTAAGARLRAPPPPETKPCPAL